MGGTMARAGETSGLFRRGAPLPNVNPAPAPVTAAKQEQRRRDAVPLGQQSTILTGSTLVGKKALLGQ